MPTGNLDALLQRMDAIAKAVNSFNSEAVQQGAFSALIAAFHNTSNGTRSIGAHPEQESQQSKPEVQKRSTVSENHSLKSTKPRRPVKSSSTEWNILKDLDLHPPGKLSFEDFVGQKQPSSNEDKYPVVVYYLSEICEIPSVTVDHVGTVFRLTKTWKEPSSLRKSLSVAASRKGTLDTKDYENIKLTPAGRNFVDHNLPIKPKPAK